MQNIIYRRAKLSIKLSVKRKQFTQNMEDRENILKKMVKNRLGVDNMERIALKKRGNKKAVDPEQMIPDFAIEAVLKRYLRYCIDQQGINFIFWRANTVHNSKKSFK